MRPSKGRDFAAGLREAEDVVDEQQRVGAGRIAELLGHRQRREGDPQAGRRAARSSGRSTMHGLLDDAAAGVADLGFLHFQPEVVPLAGPLADAGEDREAAVGAGDAGDQFGEDDRLAQPGPAEQAGLAAADERRQQVDDLDAGLEQLGLGREIDRAAAGRGGWASVRRRRPGPRPSIGSPSRLKTRPSVALPTGTVTGAPVSTHSMPRTMPSVLPRATQRTRPPPRCCCTSPVRFILTPLFSDSILTAL